MSQIFRSIEANSHSYLTKLIEIADQKTASAVDHWFSDRLLGTNRDLLSLNIADQLLKQQLNFLLKSSARLAFALIPRPPPSELSGDHFSRTFANKAATDDTMLAGCTAKSFRNPVYHLRDSPTKCDPRRQTQRSED